MITEETKREIVQAVHRESERLGSYTKVSKKLGVSIATVTNNILKEENWSEVSAKMWANVAASLGVSLVRKGWNIARTKNLNIMLDTLSIAQKEAMFLAVSDKAGSGKTASIAYCLMMDTEHAIYSMQCEEWSRKTFLVRLASQLGVAVGQYDTADKLVDDIVRFFKHRAKEVQPLLILDEADKLKPAAKRFIIPLYNRLEDEIGLVCVGTENLKKEIENGVRKAHKGYDEIASRLGRKYVQLIGYEESDVAAICEANGITDTNAITRIWNRCTPSKIGNVMIVEDARLIKHTIKAEKMRMASAA